MSAEVRLVRHEMAVYKDSLMKTLAHQGSPGTTCC